MNEPLVLDLLGEDIEIIALGTEGCDSDVYFDHDGDFFAVRTGWLSIRGAKDNHLLARVA